MKTMPYYLLSRFCLVMVTLVFMFQSLAQPVALTGSPVNEYHPKWSPDGSILAYTSRSDTETGIWTMTALGADPKQMNFCKNGDQSFNWSPDGSRIVLDAYPLDEAPCNLYVFNRETDEFKELTAWPLSENHPDWSPDGTQIVFASSSEIFLMPAEGGDAQQLVSGSDNWHPAWSPKGEYVAFTSDRSGNYDIWMVPAKGGAPEQLTQHPANDDRVCWSPDGSMIAFASERSGNHDIWIMSLETKEVRQLTDHPSFDSHPDWSPDGRKIAFASTRNGNFDIYVMDVLITGVNGKKKNVNSLNNRPNPFDYYTEIDFAIKEPAPVVLELLNGEGKCIARPLDQKLAEGMYKVRLSTEYLQEGLYFIQLSLNGERSTRKALKIKK